MKLLHLGRKVGLAVALAFCLLHLAVSTFAAEPLPVDILWQSRLNRLPGNLGPCWSDSGHAYISLFGNDTLVILRDGELVHRAVLGDIIAIDRGDVYPNIEGEEFIVALDQGDTHEVVILNGGTLQEISSFNAADEWNAWERVTALKWIGGDERKLLTGKGQTDVNHGEIRGVEYSIFRWYGRTDVYDGDSFDKIATFNTGEPKNFIQLGSDIVVFGAVIEGDLYHGGPGNRTVSVTPSITQLDSHLEVRRRFALHQITQNTTLAEFRSRYPIGILSEFACMEGDSGGTLLLSYSGQSDPKFCKIVNRGWRLVNHQRLGYETSIIPIRTNPGDESIDYVLCQSAYGGVELIFLNPYNLDVIVTDYSSPFEDYGMLEGGDFDDDGRTELLGMKDGLLTCARPQPLAVVDDPVILHPSSFILSEPFPNPFNSSTTITFSLSAQSASSAVNLAIYDLSGRLVTDLLDSAHLPTGQHKVVWDAIDQPAGVYLIRLQSGTQTSTRKIVLMR